MNSKKPKALIYFLKDDLLFELNDDSLDVRKIEEGDFPKIKNQYNLSTEYYYLGFYSYEQDKALAIYVPLKVLKSPSLTERLRAYREIWDKIKSPIQNYLEDEEALEILMQTLLGIFITSDISRYYSQN